MDVILWRVEALGPRAIIDPLADAARDADPPLALACAVFDDASAPGARRLELLFDAMPDLVAVRAAIGAPDAIDLIAGPLDDEDWVALSLQGLQPVEAGRFVLRGGHDTPAPGGRVDLLIEAGEAFGTGHHGTTRGCLLAYDALLRKTRPARVLDVGCGTGALAIAAAKTAPRATIDAGDLDPVAVRVTRENAAANGSANRITAVRADGVRHRQFADGGYDLIFANILAGPLVRLAGDIAETLAPGGRVIMSGLLVHQERTVAAAYAARGLLRERRGVLDDWVTLTFRKPDTPRSSPALPRSAPRRRLDRDQRARVERKTRPTRASTPSERR